MVSKDTIHMSKRFADTLESTPIQDTLFFHEVTDGLMQPVKKLPSKYFYDRRGSQLFDRICELEEYYPTKADEDATARFVPHIRAVLPRTLRLVELGSGSSLKTRIVLDGLDVRQYVPVDISKRHMEVSAARLQEEYPDLHIVPCEGDYTRQLVLPESDLPEVGHDAMLIYFPGSSVGNFHPHEAEKFLRRMRSLLLQHGGEDPGALFIGVDLKKDRETLELAYDDPAGVTAEFNLNILRHINDELGANFDLDAFHHRARYDEELGRIEMYLVSDRAQHVDIGGHRIAFEADEAILTEVSYKYARVEFESMARRAGFRPSGFGTDARGLFGVYLFTPEQRTRAEVS